MSDEIWDRRRIARTALVIAVVLAGVWVLWRFLPALAWAAVLAIATWPLRQRLGRHRMGAAAVAGRVPLAVAVVLVLPLVGLGIELAREGGAILEAVRDIRQNGLGTPDWLSHIPLFGD